MWKGRRRNRLNNLERLDFKLEKIEYYVWCGEGDLPRTGNALAPSFYQPGEGGLEVEEGRGGSKKG